MNFMQKRPLGHAVLAQAAIYSIASGAALAQGPRAAQTRPAMDGALRWSALCARPAHSAGALAGPCDWRKERNQPQSLGGLNSEVQQQHRQLRPR